jgi:hypothetical protein
MSNSESREDVSMEVEIKMAATFKEGYHYLCIYSYEHFFTYFAIWKPSCKLWHVINNETFFMITRKILGVRFIYVV